MVLTYDGRCFRGLQNTRNGEVSIQTIFHYSQQGTALRATYHGGEIVEGVLIGEVDLATGSLHFTYEHVNLLGQRMSGRCTSTPEKLPDVRLRLHEQWQWTCGDFSSGRSMVEEC